MEDVARSLASLLMVMMIEMSLVDNNAELMLLLIMTIQNCLIKVNSTCPQHITLKVSR